MTDFPEPRVARPVYGRGLLQTLPRNLFDRAAVLTQPEPWALVRDAFPAGTQVHFVDTMEHARVREVTGSFDPATTAVFGIGGGSALDHGKYVSWVKGWPLVLMPSILSVDAGFTKAIGVREGSRVRYVGAVYPEHFLIDYDLLQAAPKILNQAGVGDLLSIFTALWDWREAGLRVGEKYHPEIAAESQALLDRMFAGGRDIGEVGEKGLWLLSELYVGEVRLCEMVGNARPEEGSEHYFAYCLEHRTKRHYLHGALVGMGVILAGAYQGQDVGPVKRFLADVGLDCGFRAVGATREECRDALLHLGEYVRQESQLLPGVFHFRDGVPASEVDRLLDLL